MTSDFSNLDRKLGRATHITNEEIFAERCPADMSLRKTKIVCTLGPACWDEDKLVEMINAGLDVARFNFSHGDHESHKKCLDRLKKAVAKTGKKIGLMLDTKGPEIRTGLFKEGISSITLERGQNLRIVVDYNFKGDKDCIACSYPSLCASVKPGSIILIADGSVSVRVESVGDGYVDTTVLNNAVIGSRKNMNLPGVKVDLPVCGEREINDIVNFGCANCMHFIAASFVQTAQDVRDIRNILGEKGRHIKIIPKIENQEGLLNFDEILKECDGIMVARGDLGMEIPLEKVFLAQKMMIAKCNAAGKSVIVATQMLESMIKAPRPTRAEISDVANAVHDGADCVMLSGESANGAFPVQAVETLAKICVEAESSINYPMLYQAIHSLGPFPIPVPESVCSSAVETAEGIDAKLIVALTETGHTARMIAKYKPRQIILAVSASDPSICQQSLVRGVIPFQVASFQGTDSVIAKALAEAKRRNLISTGDYVVAVHGIKEEIAGSTNLMKVVICP